MRVSYLTRKGKGRRAKFTRSRHSGRLPSTACASPPRSPPRAASRPFRGSPGAAAARRCRESSSRSSTRARSTGSRRGFRRASPSSRRRTARRRRPRWSRRSCARASGSRTTLGREPRLRGRLGPARGARRRARPLRGRRGGAAGGRCGASGRARSASATSSATSSTATASWSWSRSAGATAVAALPGTRRSSRTATTRRSASSPGRPGSLVFGLDDPRRAAGAPARGRLEVLRPLRDAVRLRRRLRRPPRRLPLPELRPRAAAARRRRAARSSCTGSSAPRFDLVTPAGHAAGRAALPGLYNVYNALAAAALARALGAPLDEIVAGLERFSAAFGRFERIAVDEQAAAAAADQEPGRRERGRAHARRRRRRRASPSSR